MMYTTLQAMARDEGMTAVNGARHAEAIGNLVMAAALWRSAADRYGMAGRYGRDAAEYARQREADARAALAKQGRDPVGVMLDEIAMRRRGEV